MTGVQTCALPIYLLLNLPKQAAIAPESREVLAANIKKASESSGSGEMVFLADYFATGFRWYQASYVSIADDACAVYRIVGRVDDIHDSVMEKERLLLRTHKDEAVGLYNKVYALRSMQMSLRKKPKERMDALMFVDVDRFKNINDTVGHLEGDKILREIAAVLKKLFRSEDIVARYGGDEFMVYMPGAGSVENARKRAIQIIRNVNNIPVAYEERVRVSIGIAGTVGESVSAQEMLRRADEAMYQAKEKGKNRCVIYKKTKE